MSVSVRERGGRSIGVVDGFRAFLGGILFIITTPSVWMYALVPILMVFVLGTVLATLGVWGSFHLGDAIFSPTDGMAAQFGGWLVKGILTLIALLLAFLIALGLAQPLSGLALDAIVRAQEYALYGWTTP